MSGEDYRFKPIGFARTPTEDVPRHWSISDVEGDLVIDEAYTEGLSHVVPGQKIVVIFVFHRSPRFTPDRLRQIPATRREGRGVFSICSPIRPNPLGLSVLEVLAVEGGVIRVRGMDMLDGTPILDLKPYVTGTSDCPSGGR